MNCPVCGTSALSDDLKKCPQCESDLETFQMTKKIDQVSGFRFWYSVVVTVFFAALLIVWIITGLSDNSEEPSGIEALKEENARMEYSLQNLETENKQLKNEVKELKENVIEKKIEKKEENKQENGKRNKEYIVQNGESLFGIARKVYGNGFRYVDLAKDNNIEDPTSIQTGQKLIIYY